MTKLLASLALIIFSAAAYAQDSTLKEYTGVYKFPEGSMVSSVEIVLNGNSLLVNSSIGSVGIEKISKDTFSLPTYEGMVYFSRTEAKITGIKIEVHDVVLEGKKEDADFAFSQVAFINKHYLLLKN